MDKQAATGETTDFGSVTYENKNVKEQLFGSSITITKSNFAGDYKVTFTTDSRVFGCYFSGSLTVKTGNTPLAETSLIAPWRVEMTDYEAQVDQGPATVRPFSSTRARRCSTPTATAATRFRSRPWT